MAADEFRVEVDLRDAMHGHPLTERLHARDLDDEVAERLGDRVIVTRDGEKVYVYTSTAEAAVEAERVVKEELAEDELTADVRRRRWNAADRFWQDADEALPEAAEATPLREERRRAADEGVKTPLFVYIEAHEPEFMRDLGV